MTEKLHAWASIEKAEANDDGTCTVYGTLTDSGLDRDDQRMDQAWLDQAVPKWYSEGANIREMHPFGTTAAGVGIELHRTETGAWKLRSRIVDPIAVKKCLPGPNGEPPVYRGYSIGVRKPILDMSKADAPAGLCVGGYLCEASLADRPSNPRTVWDMVKTEGDDEHLVWVAEGGALSPDDEDESDTEPTGDGTVTKYVSAADRRTYAKQGVAMKNGDFPIPDKGHLKAAVGRLKNYKGDKAAARRHILKRARALGVSLNLSKADDQTREVVELLRAVRTASQADAIAAEMALVATVSGVDQLRKYDEEADIAGAFDAIAAIARLIQSEASELANGRLEEAHDICQLLDAVKALQYFIWCEQDQAAKPAPDSSGGSSEPAAVSPGAAQYYAETPDLRKTEGTEEEPVEQEPESDQPITLTKAEVAGMITDAVTKATAGSEERYKTLETQLAKVLQQPQAGGPAMTRTGPQSLAAHSVEMSNIATQRAALLQKAEEIGNQDPALAQGYRDTANALSRRIGLTTQ